jgi:hypothetical protein
MKRIMSLILIAVLVSTFGAATSFVGAQGGTSPVVHVGWNVANDTQHISHQYQDSLWIFGAQPNVWIGYAHSNWTWNGTNIADNQYRVNVGDRLLVNVTIPYRFLPENSILDVVNFWGQTSAVKKAAFGLQYNATSGTWNSVSLYYKQGGEKPPEPGYLVLNATHSSYANLTGFYVVVFAITFVQATVTDIFTTGMQVIDKNGTPISPSWLANQQAGEFGSPPLGLGRTVPPSGVNIPRYYYAEVTDLAGNIIHYVDYGTSFTFRMVSNVRFGDVTIPFCILSVAKEYELNYNWSMPKDLYRYSMDSHDWVNETGMPLFLSFVHNATGTYVLPGYLYNITWTWMSAFGQWSVKFDVKFNNTINKFLFYHSLSAGVGLGGLELKWRGWFEKAVDMNPDPYDVGGTISPEPSFWRVLDNKGRLLDPRQEITTKNTVRLAFRSAFIEAFVRDLTGKIVNRAMPGQMLNVTLEVHSPAERVNGSYYIVVNQTNVAVPNSTLHLDIDGLFVNRLRQNITIIFEGGGIVSNQTMVVNYAVVHTITIDFVHHTLTSLSGVFYRETDRSTGALIAQDSIPSTTMLATSAWHVSIGKDLSKLWFTIAFTDAAPPIMINKATIVSDLFERYWMNASLHGLNSYVMIPIGNQSLSEAYLDNVVWSPRNLLIGNAFVFQEQTWAVTPDGAIDLDGNPFTFNDQYFVLRTGTWHDWGNITKQGMEVGIVFDPTPGIPGDEFASSTWMGVVKMIINFNAAETFAWYHASNGTRVESAEMSQIQDRLWAVKANATFSGIPAPGYEWVAWMSVNRTIDLSGIPALKSSSWSNTWFAWGTTQAFQVSTSTAIKQWAAFRAQYAGLLLFRDLPNGTVGAPDFKIVDGRVQTDEVTHFVLIDSVGKVELKRPLNAITDHGSADVAPATLVNFGITIRNVNVTIYPLRVENSNAIRGAWDIRQSSQGTVGLNSTNFDYWVTPANVNVMSFNVSFHVDMVNYNPSDALKWNHAVVFKISQVIGNWTLYDFDSSILNGRSLAVNYFGVLGTATKTQYSAGQKPVTDPNGQSVNASYYEFRAANNPFANVTMGGLPYTYGGDAYSTIYTSGSSTAPIGAFSAMYESASGDSVTNWKVEASMLFMTAGYQHWGGHEIRCDPVFISYTTAHPVGSTTTTSTTTTGTTSTTTTSSVPPTTINEMTLYIAVAGVVAFVVMLVVLVRRR